MNQMNTSKSHKSFNSFLQSTRLKSKRRKTKSKEKQRDHDRDRKNHEKKCSLIGPSSNRRIAFQ